MDVKILIRERIFNELYMYFEGKCLHMREYLLFPCFRDLVVHQRKLLGHLWQQKQKLKWHLYTEFTVVVAVVDFFIWISGALLKFKLLKWELLKQYEK